jgi:glycosyltransferase involved in cell wall biosynthesis
LEFGRVLVVVPTYNERDNLPRLVDRVRRSVPGVDLLVVDDDSPDGTGTVADNLAQTDPAVHVLHRPTKSGLGAAYLAGFDVARANDYDVVVEMDADGSHAPEELPRLLSALGTADVVLGSRWVPGGAVRNWPFHRRLLSRGGNTYARLLLNLPLADATGGYRAYRMTALEAVQQLAAITSEGYCFQIELAWRAQRAGCRVVEVPITFVERTAGESKMSRATVAEAVWRVTWWGLRARWHRMRMGRSDRSETSRG